jgi:hypothetical protein
MSKAPNGRIIHWHGNFGSLYVLAMEYSSFPVTKSAVLLTCITQNLVFIEYIYCSVQKDGKSLNVNVTILLPCSPVECTFVSEDPAVCVLLPEDGEIRFFQNVSNDLQTTTVMSQKTVSNIQNMHSIHRLQTLLTDGECMLDSKCNPLPVAAEVVKPGAVDGQKKPSTSIDRESVGTSKMPGRRETAHITEKGTRSVSRFGIS